MVLTVELSSTGNLSGASRAGSEYERENLPPVATLQPVRSFFRRLSKECGFAVSPHRFRHKLTTELMKSPDRNLQMVKGLLGHRSVTTTMEYIDINLDVTGQTLERELGLYIDIKRDLTSFQ